MPIPISTRPTKVKNQPEGTLKSISSKPDIQNDEQDSDQHGQRRGTFIPFGGGVMRHLGQSVNQALHFLCRARTSGQAYENRDGKTDTKRQNRDPEILRHYRREVV